MRAAGWPGPGEESGPADGPSPTPLQGRRLGAGPGQNLGPPGLGCRGEALAGLSVALGAGLAWTRSRTAGGSGEGMWEDACCAQFFVGFLFFVFFLKKKKKKSLVSTGVGVCVLLCRHGEGRPDGALSSGGAQAASLGERRIVRGSGLGGQGTASCFPRWFIQPRTDGSYAGGGKGDAPLLPLGSGSLPSISQRSGTWLSGCACLPGVPLSLA